MKQNYFLTFLLPQTDKPLFNKRNKLSVMFMVAVCLYGIIFSIWDFILGFQNTALVNLFLSAVSIISLILLKNNKHFSSKVTMIIGSTIVLCSHYILFKQQTLILGYAVPLFMCSIAIFRGKHLAKGIFVILVCLIMFAGVIGADYHPSFAYILGIEELKEQRIINIGGMFILCFFFSYFIVRINEDIHEFLLIQGKELEESNLKLKETIKTRDKLFSLIAHDLKGPFQSMSASHEILSASDTSVKDKEMVITNLSKKAENTIILLNNLLLWSQHQTETIKFRPETIKLDTAGKNILEQFKIQALEKNISIDLNFSQSKAVYADRNMFDCIMRNLISNAIKFTETGGEIVIKCMEVGLSTRFVISDNGVGMDELVKEMLLNKQSYSSAGTNREQGHGLGMMLIHEFLKMHKSELKIETEKGKGSSFSFLLNNA